MRRAPRRCSACFVPASRLPRRPTRCGPAYLELRQTGAGDLRRAVEGAGAAARSALGPVRGAAGRLSTLAHRAAILRRQLHERWTRATAPGGLDGGTIRIDGLAATLTDVLVRLERLDGTTQVTPAHARRPAFVGRPPRPGRLEVAGTYLKLGVEHILLGIDHLLFVLALLIVVRGTRRLIVTVTAFTLAHSVTLAGATLGLRARAGSAGRGLHRAQHRVRRRGDRARPRPAGLTARRPWVVAFAFGLLHGFGLCRRAHESGCRRRRSRSRCCSSTSAWRSGQLLFIVAVLAVIAVARGLPVALPAWSWRVPPYAIGAIASFWLIERLAALGA